MLQHHNMESGRPLSLSLSLSLSDADVVSPGLEAGLVMPGVGGPGLVQSGSRGSREACLVGSGSRGSWSCRVWV